MSTSTTRFSFFVALTATTFLAACDAPEAADGAEDIQLKSSGLTASQRLTACAQDPRVVTGLARAQICAGADIFFRETFNGNGRTCGTCHPTQNNFTIDARVHQSLPPTDPLFVFERDPPTSRTSRPRRCGSGRHPRERRRLRGPDPQVRRSAVGAAHAVDEDQHRRRSGDPGTTTPPVERTGWGGDGAPGDGSLRSS